MEETIILKASCWVFFLSFSFSSKFSRHTLCSQSTKTNAHCHRCGWLCTDWFFILLIPDFGCFYFVPILRFQKILKFIFLKEIMGILMNLLFIYFWSISFFFLLGLFLYYWIDDLKNSLALIFYLRWLAFWSFYHFNQRETSIVNQQLSISSSWDYVPKM